MKTRSRLTRELRREQLIEFGVRFVTERPYDDFSLDEVAEKAGVTRTLLYHYFPTKRDFYLATLKAAASQLLHLTDPDPGVPPEDAVRSGLDAYLGYVADHAAAFRAVLRGGLGADPEVMKVADGVRERIYDRVVAGLGLREPVEPAVRVAVVGWIGFVEAVSLDWASRRHVERPALVDALSQTLSQALMQWASVPIGAR